MNMKPSAQNIFTMSSNLAVCVFAGKNDGSVKGVRYFSCRNRHGIFVRPDKLIWDKKRKLSRKGSSASSRRSMPGLSSSLSNLSRSPSGASPSNQSSSSYMKSTSSSVAKKK